MSKWAIDWTGGANNALTKEDLQRAIDLFSKEEIRPNTFAVSATEWYGWADLAIEIGFIESRKQMTEQIMWDTFAYLGDIERWFVYLMSMGWRSE